MKTTQFGRRNSAYVSGFLAISAATLALPGSLSAALTVYEPFNYTAASTLGGQNGGTGFSGAWSAAVGSSTVSSPSLSYASLSTVGNRATTTAASATTQNRGLSASLGGVTGTTYISFLLRPDAATSAANAEFGLVGTTASLFVGKASSGNTSNYLLDTLSTGGGTQNASSTAFANGTAVLMVLRADFVGGGGDTFKLFINPTSTTEPGSADATKSGYDLGTVGTIQFTGNLGFSFDELKIGSSYADVVPEPSTYAAGLAVAGLVGMTWLRRRTAAK
jgi:hypothetical protein